MRVVLDTNVLVSGLLSPFGPCARMLNLLLTGRIQACHDARILAEYAEVLARPKFRIAPHEARALLDYIAREGRPVTPVPLPFSLPDPDDAPFLEAAIAGRADYLITGNTRHYPAGRRQGVAVVTAGAFLREMTSSE